MRTQFFRIILALMIAATFALSTAHARGGKYDAHFGDMDTNGDEIVDQDEFTTHFKDQADPAGAFSIIDRDKSGGLDHDEWHAFKDAHGYGHGDTKKEECTGHGQENPHGKKSE